MNGNYCTVEELICRVEQRPKMYIYENRLDYIFYLLTGHMICAKQTNSITEKDLYFQRRFFKWLINWAKEKYNKEYGDKAVFWYHIIEDNTNSNEDAVAKFYELSKQFFSEYKDEETKIDGN